MFPSLTFLSCQIGLSSAEKGMPTPWSVGSDYCVGALLLIALWTIKKLSPIINISRNICCVIDYHLWGFAFFDKILCPKIMSIFL